MAQDAAVAEDTPLETKRLYYDNTELYECDSIVQKCTGDSVVLDQTVFHPQGGGQPSDLGLITSEDGKTVFKVESVRNNEDEVIHFGTYEQGGPFSTDDKVKLQVDSEKRKLHSRLHSAGHLIDVALAELGRTDLKPGKGYHWEVGTYVEYIGKVEPEEKQELIDAINLKVNELIQQNLETAPERSYVDGVRNIKLISQDHGWGCGGTHVEKIGDIGQIEIHKIKKKKSNI